MTPGVEVGVGDGAGVGDGKNVGVAARVGDAVRVTVAAGPHAPTTMSARARILTELP